MKIIKIFLLTLFVSQILTTKTFLSQTHQEKKEERHGFIFLQNNSLKAVLAKDKSIDNLKLSGFLQRVSEYKGQYATLELYLMGGSWTIIDFAELNLDSYHLISSITVNLEDNILFEMKNVEKLYAQIINFTLASISGNQQTFQGLNALQYMRFANQISLALDGTNVELFKNMEMNKFQDILFLQVSAQQSKLKDMISTFFMFDQTNIRSLNFMLADNQIKELLVFKYLPRALNNFYLDVKGNQIRDLQELAYVQCKYLKSFSLDLSNNPLRDLSEFEYLANWKNLEKVALKLNGISSLRVEQFEHLMALKHIRKNLKELSVEFSNSAMSNHFLSNISNFQSLEKLELASFECLSNIDFKFVEYLSVLSGLKSLKLNFGNLEFENADVNSLSMLGKLENLKFVDLAFQNTNLDGSKCGEIKNFIQKQIPSATIFMNCSSSQQKQQLQ